MIRRHHFLRGLAAALALGAAMPAALAQSSKPIRLVVPFPAGGATDLFARTLSQKMGERLGTSVVIDNKPGAGGSLGSDMAAKAAADGQTLLFTTNRVNTAANQALSDPEVRAKLTTLGIEPVTSTPAQFAKMVADDQAKWKRIIAERKIVNE
ncbi:hypothetical protein J1N44_07920 [Acidovorax temperans]|uniref:tripartite tricarboxylate transporter substrate-binding protein n=1 Tax=Acidovorax temperans TaxID=80878 RepID=UPI001A943B49|nr:tripartite tricarboxylate transporter substrate-binding protein [Acidovorax temperans]MBO0941622.1 hypothetical protein [Acidovorax temperans]